MKLFTKTALGVLGGAAALGMALSGAPAYAAANVTVTPATSLPDRATVSVTATGLSADTTYIVGQCKDFALPVTGVPACNFGPKAYVRVSGQTATTVSLNISRTFSNGHGGGGEVDCKVDKCVIAVVPHGRGGPGAGAAQPVKAPLTFA